MWYDYHTVEGKSLFYNTQQALIWDILLGVGKVLHVPPPPPPPRGVRGACTPKEFNVASSVATKRLENSYQKTKNSGQGGNLSLTVCPLAPAGKQKNK